MQPLDNSRSTKHVRRTVACDFPDCGKVYNRSDHLLRHKQNHEATVYHCKYCARDFIRPDLLSRHVARHVAKGHTVPQDGRDGSLALSGVEDDGGVGNGVVYDGAGDSTTTTLDNTTWNNADPGPSNWLPPAPPLRIEDDPSYSLVLEYTVPSSVPSLPPVPIQLNAFDPFADQSLWPDGWEADTWSLDPVGEMDVFGILGALEWPEVGSLRWPGDYAVGGGVVVQNDPLQLPQTIRPPWNDLHESTWQRMKAFISNHEATSSEFSYANCLHLLSTFFSHIYPIYSYIHRPTFDPQKTSLRLLWTIILLGSHHGSLSHNTFTTLSPSAQGITRQLRGSLAMDMEPPLSLEFLQSFVLLGIFSDLMGPAAFQETAHGMNSLLVVLTRRVNIFVDPTRTSVTWPAGADLDDVWQRWIDAETLLRITHQISIQDTQIATFFGMKPSRTFSIFAIQLPMPCSSGEWESSTSYEWWQLYQQSPQRQSTETNPRSLPSGESDFLPALHPDFSPNVAPPGLGQAIIKALTLKSDPNDSRYHKSIALHGLMTVAWDIRMKGSLGVNFRVPAIQQWKTNVMSSYVALTDTATQDDDRSLLDHLCLSVVSLLADITALQVFAGATNVCGCTIGPRQYESARRRLKLWVKTEEAALCFRYSTVYLQGLVELPPTGFGLHTQWAGVIACLVCWAYGFLTEGRDDYIKQPTDQAQQLAHSQWYLKRFSQLSMQGIVATSGKNATSSLIRTVIRLVDRGHFELVALSVQVLKGLIGESRK